MHRVPDAVDVGNLVGDELDDEERDRKADDERAGEDLELVGKVDQPEALKQPGGGNRGVEIEPRGE